MTTVTNNITLRYDAQNKPQFYVEGRKLTSISSVSYLDIDNQVFTVINKAGTLMTYYPFNVPDGQSMPLMSLEKIVNQKQKVLILVSGSY